MASNTYIHEPIPSFVENKSKSEIQTATNDDCKILQYEGYAQIFVAKGKKSKFKTCRICLQSVAGLFSSMIIQQKQRFLGKSFPIIKYDLHKGFDIILGETLTNNKFTFEILLHATPPISIVLAVLSADQRCEWIYQIFSKIQVDPFSKKCHSMYLVRIEDTTAASKFKLCGNSSLYIYEDILIFARSDNSLLARFPFNTIKSYLCETASFNITLSRLSMVGNIILYLRTEQCNEIFEIVHFLIMKFRGIDLPYPTLLQRKAESKKKFKDDSTLDNPILSKEINANKFEDSLSDTDILHSLEDKNHFTSKSSFNNTKLNYKPTIGCFRTSSNALEYSNLHKFSILKNRQLPIPNNANLNNFNWQNEPKSKLRRISDCRSKDADPVFHINNIEANTTSYHSHIKTRDEYSHVIFKPANAVIKNNQNDNFLQTSNYEKLKIKSSISQENLLSSQALEQNIKPFSENFNESINGNLNQNKLTKGNNIEYLHKGSNLNEFPGRENEFYNNQANHDSYLHSQVIRTYSSFNDNNSSFKSGSKYRQKTKQSFKEGDNSKSNIYEFIQNGFLTFNSKRRHAKKIKIVKSASQLPPETSEKLFDASTIKPISSNTNGKFSQSETINVKNLGKSII